MKIMVLGGAGFIGSAFVRELNSRKIKPLVFDLLTYAGRLENLSGTDYDFVKGDIRDSKLHDVIASFRPEIIVNFAAETHVDRSIYKPQDFVTTNILGTVNILEALRLYNFKYVHVSTDEVYGEECADENSPLNPSSPYSASKASADLLVKSYVRTYNVEAIIVRPSNNYGPRQFPEKFIPKTIIRTLLGLHVPIYGDGKQERDWIYVEDTAKIIADLLPKAEWKGNVYNLPGGQRVTNIEIIKLLEEIMNRKIEVRFVSDRPGHDKRYCMINTKLRYTSTTLADGLRKVYEWYVNNRWWWEPLISNKFFREDEPWKTV
ncbi:NAD-dependent epimerase/dehydratase [Sulfolobus islandicus Y.G.57.14]|uniref:NAD-dependent epimerase/dehydratase n=3 Tax=Saccharolobus islandicus TaxID=43080 RepID=C3MNX0_SACI2|nr:dTDP-glucose 4,6-dehydratase [Sulfolobus islandicus]ACP35083.1 NAD-dependent epimerase/dehydratase [Sulfolobus islandicus L.S.2.15]ACP44866.1 NAD-dependent epimerase/dehydratase [Sulfolobus islandicus Y.G.57.14]ADB86377.1 NAD-dependent epimerase/dehydratase [Sulfolobus islandicus L.D.8.5]